MNAKPLITLGVTVLLFGCATYPQTGEEQAAYHADKARAAITKNEGTNAVFQIELALGRPTGDARIRELFGTDNKGRDIYRAYLEKEISKISGVLQSASLLATLLTAKSAGIFTDDQINSLFMRLE